ncbi:MAG: ABC transporter permease [Pirellulaceae bacterium]
MTFEHYDIPDFFEWFVPALLVWFPLAVAALCFGGWLLGFLISAARRGPVEGFYAVAKVIASGVNDLRATSLRRTMAIALLAVQESIRRKVLVVFAIFVVALLLAGWYLDVQSDSPAKLYLSFVLTASNYLVLVLALMLSTFSLPTDIKNKTIYTIVTKPVRLFEIVLGRIVGFSLIGTFILAGMCVISYVFVVRGLSHTHEVETTPTVMAGETGPPQGETTQDAHHRHTFILNEDGEGETNVVAGHKHYIRRIGEGPDATFEIGPPVDSLQARNPIYGTLTFKDRAGTDAEAGINVGHEWMYRSYIEGGTLAEAIWEYDNVTADRFPDGLDLELNLRAFRTHKGNIERGVRGSFYLENPDPTANFRRTEDIPFIVKEFAMDRRFVPRKLRLEDKDHNFHDGDIFEQLCTNGRLRLHVKCMDPGQYLGMARPDVYLLDSSTPFYLNFIKGYVGIWLQLVLVTTFGVMFSTFLSAPVAMMSTLASIVIGYFGEFIAGVTLSTINPESLEANQGGGPIEALIRTAGQLNLQIDPEIGSIPLKIVRAFDFAFMQLMSLVTVILPDYVSFSTAEYVANGFNIGPELMGILLLKTAAYVGIVSLVAFFFFKTREIASS